MTTQEQLRQLRQSIAVAQASLEVSERSIAAARKNLSALSEAVDELELAPRGAAEMLSVDNVVRKYAVSRRMVLAARRRGHLRSTTPAGSNVILFEPSDVEEWIHARDSHTALRVAR